MHPRPIVRVIDKAQALVDQEGTEAPFLVGSIDDSKTEDVFVLIAMNFDSTACHHLLLQLDQDEVTLVTSEKLEQMPNLARNEDVPHVRVE